MPAMLERLPIPGRRGVDPLVWGGGLGAWWARPGSRAAGVRWPDWCGRSMRVFGSCCWRAMPGWHDAPGAPSGHADRDPLQRVTS